VARQVERCSTVSTTNRTAPSPARLARAKGLGEINDWHKIRLSITREVSSAAGEGEVTGERYLHFVRMFTRWRLGRLEYVKDHWRGNPEKGVSLTSYKVRP
jgi:hypothetical protein